MSHVTKIGVTGAVEYDFVHLVTAWPSPNIPVLIVIIRTTYKASIIPLPGLPKGQFILFGRVSY